MKKQTLGSFSPSKNTSIYLQGGQKIDKNRLEHRLDLIQKNFQKANIFFTDASKIEQHFFFNSPNTTYIGLFAIFYEKNIFGAKKLFKQLLAIFWLWQSPDMFKGTLLEPFCEKTFCGTSVSSWNANAQRSIRKY